MTGHRVIGAAFLAFAALIAPACADDTDEYLAYTELACAPGSEIPCACAGDNGRGMAVCRSDGSGYGACERCTGPGTCTVFPNCRGCVSCIDQCLCQSSEQDPGACTERCKDEGGAGGAGGSGGCIASECPQPGIGLAQTCCTANNTCGFVFQLLSPDCIEGNQPGAADAACPPVSITAIQLTGCCREDGRCGAMDTYIGYGCVDPSQFGMPRGARCGG